MTGTRLTLGPENLGLKHSFFRTDWAALRAMLVKTNLFGSVRLSVNKTFKRIHLPDLVKKFHAALADRFLDRKSVELYNNLKPFCIEMINDANTPVFAQDNLWWLEKRTNILPSDEACLVQIELHNNIHLRLLAKKYEAETPDINSGNFVHLKRMMRRINSISPTSAECERIFSQMNHTHTEYRNSFSTRAVDDNLTVRKSGPPPALLEARKVAIKLVMERKINESSVNSYLTSELEQIFETFYWSQADLVEL
jgi:hypothetical protein